MDSSECDSVRGKMLGCSGTNGMQEISKSLGIEGVLIEMEGGRKMQWGLLHGGHFLWFRTQSARNSWVYGA